MVINNSRKQVIEVDGIHFDPDLNVDDELEITMYCGDLHFTTSIPEIQIPRLIKLLENVQQDEVE